MKILSDLRYKQLLEIEKEFNKEKGIIDHYYYLFNQFCNEYDIQIDYKRDDPIHNFSMIRKRFLELYTNQIPFLIKKFNLKFKEENKKLKEENIVYHHRIRQMTKFVMIPSDKKNYIKTNNL